MGGADLRTTTPLLLEYRRQTRLAEGPNATGASAPSVLFMQTECLDDLDPELIHWTETDCLCWRLA